MRNRARFTTSRQHFISSYQLAQHKDMKLVSTATKRPAFYFDCSALARACVVIMT